MVVVSRGMDLGSWRVTVMVDGGLVLVSREMDCGSEWYG